MPVSADIWSWKNADGLITSWLQEDVNGKKPSTFYSITHDAASSTFSLRDKRGFS